MSQEEYGLQCGWGGLKEGRVTKERWSNPLRPHRHGTDFGFYSERERYWSILSREVNRLHLHAGRNTLLSLPPAAVRGPGRRRQMHQLSIVAVKIAKIWHLENNKTESSQFQILGVQNQFLEVNNKENPFSWIFLFLKTSCIFGSQPLSSGQSKFWLPCLLLPPVIFLSSSHMGSCADLRFHLNNSRCSPLLKTLNSSPLRSLFCHLRLHSPVPGLRVWISLGPFSRPPH